MLSRAPGIGSIAILAAAIARWGSRFHVTQAFSCEGPSFRQPFRLWHMLLLTGGHVEPVPPASPRALVIGAGRGVPFNSLSERRELGTSPSPARRAAIGAGQSGHRRASSTVTGGFARSSRLFEKSKISSTKYVKDQWPV